MYGHDGSALHGADKNEHSGKGSQSQGVKIAPANSKFENSIA